MLVLQTTNSGMGAGVSSAVARALGAKNGNGPTIWCFMSFCLRSRLPQFSLY